MLTNPVKRYNYNLDVQGEPELYPQDAKITREAWRVRFWVRQKEQSLWKKYSFKIERTSCSQMERNATRELLIEQITKVLLRRKMNILNRTIKEKRRSERESRRKTRGLKESKGKRRKL